MNIEALKKDLALNTLQDGKKVEEVAKMVRWDVETVKKLKELNHINQQQEESCQETTNQAPKTR